MTTTTVCDVVAAGERPVSGKQGAGDAVRGTVDVQLSYRRTDPPTIGSAQPTGRLSR
jgi:hypothetical protein